MTCGNCGHDTMHNLTKTIDFTFDDPVLGCCEELGCFCNEFKTISEADAQKNKEYHEGTYSKVEPFVLNLSVPDSKDVWDFGIQKPIVTFEPHVCCGFLLCKCTHLNPLKRIELKG